MALETSSGSVTKFTSQDRPRDERERRRGVVLCGAGISSCLSSSGVAVGVRGLGRSIIDPPSPVQLACPLHILVQKILSNWNYFYSTQIRLLRVLRSVDFSGCHIVSGRGRVQVAWLP